MKQYQSEIQKCKGGGTISIVLITLTLLMSFLGVTSAVKAQSNLTVKSVDLSGVPDEVYQFDVLSGDIKVTYSDNSEKVLKVSETTTSFSTGWFLGSYTAWFNLPIPKETISEQDFSNASIDDWTTNWQGPSFSRIDVDNNFCIKYECGEAGANVWDKQAIYTLNTPMRQNYGYTVKIKVKADNEGGVALWPIWSTSDNRNPWDGSNDVQNLEEQAVGKEWQELEWTFSADFPHDKLQFIFGKQSGNIYFDDLKVIELLSVEKEITIVDNPNTTVSYLFFDNEIPANAPDVFTFSYSGSLNGEYKWVSGVPFRNLTIEPAIDYTNFTDWQYCKVTYKDRTENCDFKVYKLIDKMELSDVPTEIYQNEQIIGGKVHIIYKDKTEETLDISELSNYTFGYYIGNGWNSFSTSQLGTKDIFLNYHGVQSNTVTITVKADPNEPQKDSKGNYKIATAGNLLWFNRYVRNQDNSANAVLTNDIVFNENLLDEGGNLNEENIVNVWDNDFSYHGTFDGRGYTISGLYSVSNNWCDGSFCYEVGQDATIQNLGLIDCYIDKKYNRAGICCRNYGTISNCFTAGTSLDYGLCYENEWSGIIKNSYSLCFSSYYLMVDNYNIIENCYENSDFKTEDGEPRWGLTLSTEELCSGKLPDGFSSQLWSAGRIEGDTYIFPQLKKFANPVSITPGDVEISLPKKSEYETGDEIDLTGAKVGKSYRGFVISGNQAITKDNVTGFSTEKAGEFTAIIKVGNTKTEYPYTVKGIDHIEFYGIGVLQNSDLSEYSFPIYYNDGTREWCQLSNPDAELHNFDVTKVGVYENTYVTYKGFTSNISLGQVYEPVESFDLSNVSTEVYQYERLSGKVIVNYKNGNKEEIDVTKICSDIFSYISENYEAWLWYNGYSQPLYIIVKANPNQPSQDENGVYQIGTAEQLYWFANYVNAQNWDVPRTMNAVLTADIVMNENLWDDNGELIESNALRNWTPIEGYRGTFDGQGHTITGLYSNQQNPAGFTDGLYGTIQNLGIVDCYVESKQSHACVFSAYTESGSSISNCYSTGKIVGNNWVAGICVGMCTPQNCYSLCELQTTGESYMRCGLAENSDATSFINSDYNENLWSRGAITLSTKELCNGQLPEGLSSTIWRAGSIKGNVYTYPQLKVFPKPVSFTLPSEYTIIIPKNGVYNIGDEIDYSDITIGQKIPGTSVFINKEDVKDNNPTVSDFSTTKPGTYTATITCKGATAQYTYKVSSYQKPHLNWNEYYSINNASELLWFADFVNAGNTTANAMIYGNITLNENLSEKVESGNTDDLIEWIPIGTKENPFKGELRFYSNCVISGLYVNNPEQDYVGFFGYCNLKYDSLYIKDSYFKGRNYVGGVFGYCSSNYGNVSNNNYFIGSVSGNDYVGGLAGYINVPISNSYVCAKVEGNSHTGALFGYTANNNFTNCYYNNSISKLPAIPGYKDEEEKCVGKSEEAFLNGEVAYLLGRNSTHDYFYWGQNLQNQEYPNVFSQFFYNAPRQYIVHKNPNGNGYHNPEYHEDHPDICKICMPVIYQAPEEIGGVYQISTKDHLLWFMQSMLLGQSYSAKLTADIEFNDIWYTTDQSSYGDVFDGNYHKIVGLKSENTRGMFFGLSGEIKNLILDNADFKGQYVGGIVYENYGTITNCVFDGEINATECAGGICNMNYGTISGCINAGKITARSTGGIAVWQDRTWQDEKKCVIENCYNTGEIISTNGDDCAGIIRESNGEINYCYNTGKIAKGNSIVWSDDGSTHSIYNNYDVCNPDNDYGVNYLSTAEFCNGELMGDFSSDIWVAGTTEKKDGKVTYTFPHLKALAKAYPAYTLEDTYEREVESIEIKTYPQKLTYVENEELDFSDGKLLVKYNYGDDEVISLTADDVEISDPNRELEYFDQEQTLTVTYQGQECLLKGVKIIELQLLGINLTAPTKETYILGQELNLEGGKLELLWNDNDNEIYDLAEDIEDEELSIIIPGNFTTQAGKKIITVKYETFEKSFIVNVVARTVASIKIATDPDNTEYYQTHDYDLSGGKLEVSYEGLTITDELDLTSSDITIVGYDAYTLGAQTLKVVYMGKITELPVTVKERKVSSVSISKIPPKDTYNQGDAIDGSDGKIKVVYENEDEEIISMTDDGVSFSVKGDTENKDVYVIYGGVMSNDFFTVEFKTPERTISSIEMDSYPQYEYSGKESLNINGGWIKVNYTEGEPDWIALSDENVSVSEMDPTIIDEEQRITVTYCGKFTSFAIKIIKSLTDVELAAPTKTDYVVGQTLSLIGGKIVYNYNDGSEEIVDLIDDKVMVSGYNSETAAENLPVTVTYNNERIGVFYVNIVDKTIENIVFQEPTKLKYVQGQSLDLTGGYIKYEYNDGSYETVDLTDDMVFGFNSDEPNDELKVFVTYGDYHNFFFVNITAKTVTDVRFTAPTKTDYIQGQALDLNDAYLTVAYNNGDVDVVYLSDDMVEGFDSSTPAENGQTVTVKPYKGFSNFDRTFVVKIAKKFVTEIVVVSMPEKTTYIETEDFDNTGLVVKAICNDGTEFIVDDNDLLMSAVWSAENEENYVTIAYEYEPYKNRYAEIPVTIIAWEVVSIEVTAPTKTSYKKNTEDLDLTGGKIVATYNDGYERTVNLLAKYVSGFDNTKLNDALPITVTYEGKTDVFYVQIIPADKVLKSIAITKQPEKLEYVSGQSLDVSDGELTLTFTDKSTEVISLLQASIEDYNPENYGRQNLKVTYLGKETTLQVTIIEKALESVYLVAPSKTDYIIGESLNLNGGKIVYTYNDGEVESVDLTPDMISGFKNDEVVSDLSVSVTCDNELIGTFKVNILDKTIDNVSFYAPDKVTYIVGQQLDLTGGYIYITYTDDTHKKVDLTENMISGFNSQEPANKQQVTVTYGENSYNFDVTILAKEITSIVLTAPTKTDYIQGQALDLNDAYLTVAYNNGDVDVVYLSDDMVEGFDSSLPAENGQTVTVKPYKGFSNFDRTFVVKIAKRIMTGLTLTKVPEQTEYICTDAEYENLMTALSECEFEITYNDGTKSDYKYQDSDFDNSVLWHPGTVTVNMWYYDNGTQKQFPVSFDVTVIAWEVVSIEVTAPTKTSYKKNTEDLDLTGGKIVATYNDGDKKDFDLLAEYVSGFDNSALNNELPVTVTFEGKTDRFYVKIVPAKEISSIAITKQPAKLTYFEGESLSVSDGELTITYSDNSTEKVSLSLATIAKPAGTGSQNLKVAYIGKETTLSVTVKAKELESIALTTKPTKLEYIEGQVLDLTGGVLTLTYNDNSTETITLPSSDVTVSGFDATQIKTQPITLTYEGKTATFDVEVIAKVISSIAVTTKPTKLEYIEGQSLDVIGGVLTATYNDNSTENVTLPSDKVTISGFDATQVKNQTITLTYEGKTATFDVKVIAKAVSSISVTTKPTKLEYIAGQVLDLKDGVLTLTYDNGTTSTVNFDNKDVKISGFDSSKPGEQTITVEYSGKTATLTVTVTAKVLEGIAITTNPEKLSYIRGQVLDLTGGVLTATYNDNSTETVNLKSENVKVSGFDATQTGKQTITVEYGGKTATFEVIVNAEQLVEIEVTTLPTKVEYIEGQELEISGGVLTLTFDNNTTSTVNVDDKDVKISGFDKTKTGEQTVTVEYSGKTATFKVEVNNKQLVKVDIIKAPQVEYAFGEALNLKGGVIKATFNNGEEMEVDLSYLTVSGYDANKAGKQTLTAEYKGKTITFDVTVKEEEQPENPEQHEDPNTATEDIVATSNVKIWAFENTVYVENAANEIVIVDMSGRVVKRINPTSDRMEIQLNKGGIYIIKTGLATKKVSVQ